MLTKFHARSPEEKKIFARKRNERIRFELLDSYVASSLRGRTTDFPQALIEAKRQHIKLIRILKEKVG